MKNIIIVDIDTDRDPVVQIGKMEGSELPKNSEDAKEVIIKDMACLTEALCVLVDAADQSNIKTVEESMKDITTHLERSLEDITETEVDVKITEVDDTKDETTNDG